MLVIVDGQLSSVHCPNFVYKVDDYETALESLHGLVNTGWILARITLLENDGRRMALPVDLFDGQSFQLSFQALQAQWEHVLQGVP